MIVATLMNDRNELNLVRWNAESNHLTLARQPDGRIDLTDCNCADTGTDCSDWTMPKLLAEVKNWLRCVEADENETREAIAQAEAAIA